MSAKEYLIEAIGNLYETRKQYQIDFKKFLKFFKKGVDKHF